MKTQTKDFTIETKRDMQTSECESILAALLQLGCRLLVSGCDVSRVERSIEQMCDAYGMEEVEVFIITSSIVVSVKDKKGKHVTITKRIRHYHTDFYCVQLLEEIVKKVCASQPTAEQIERWLHHMEKVLQKEHTWKQGIGGYLLNAVVAATFTLFFGGTIQEAGVSIVCCFFATYTVRYLEKAWQNLFAAYVFSSLVCGLAACVFMHLGVIGSVDKVNMGNIMLLIPGLAIVNAFKDFILGEMLSGLLRLAQAIVQALAVALGFAICLVWM